MELCDVLSLGLLSKFFYFRVGENSGGHHVLIMFFPFLLFSSSPALLFPPCLPQQFGKILDVEIIFNERGSKVSAL